MENDIFVSNLSKTYKNGTVALSDVSLSIKKGSCFALLGPNGAGKSTFVRILTTLSKADTGSISIANMNPSRDVKKIHHRIGVALQENDLDPAEDVMTHLMFQGQLFGLSRPDAKKRVDELVVDFNLESEALKKANSLSGGNKRRLHCAMALVHKPNILFLDEPTVGMDPEGRAHFWTTISRINREDKVTVLLTTQYLEEADKYSDAMALILKGEIKYQGTVSSFKKMVHPDTEASLEESYLKYIRSIGDYPEKKEIEGDAK